MVKFNLNNLPFNKKQILTLIITGIVLVSIPGGVYLSQKTQVLKSRASEAGDLGLGCSDDHYYCDNGRYIHKTGGYLDDNGVCQYAFVDSGVCPSPIASLTPTTDPVSSSVPSDAGPDYLKWKIFMIDTFDIYPVVENGEIVIYDREHFTQKYCLQGGCYLNDRPFRTDELLNSYQKDFDFITDLMAKLYDDGYNPYLSLLPYFPTIKELVPPQYTGLTSPFLKDQFKVYIEPGKLTEYIIKLNREKGFAKADNVFSERDPFKLFVALSDPIFSTRAIVEVVTLKPNKISDDTRINAVLGLTFIYGASKSVVTNGVKLAAATRINYPKMTAKVAEYKAALSRGEQLKLKSVLANMKSTLDDSSDGWLSQIHPSFERELYLIYEPGGKGLPNTARATERESALLSRYTSLIIKGKASLVNPEIGRDIMINVRSVLFRLGLKPEELYSLEGGTLRQRNLLPNGSILNKIVDDGWVIALNDPDFNLIYGKTAQAVTAGRVVVIRKSLIEARSFEAYAALSHEFIHVFAGVNFITANRIFNRFTSTNPEENARILIGVLETTTDSLALQANQIGSAPYLYHPEFYKLWKNLLVLSEELRIRSGGKVDSYDFYEFALTLDDIKLLEKVKPYMEIDEFFARLSKDVDTNFPIDILAVYKNNLDDIPSTNTFSLFDLFRAHLVGKNLPDGSIILTPPFPTDLSSSNTKTVTNILVGNRDIYRDGSLSCGTSVPNCSFIDGIDKKENLCNGKFVDTKLRVEYSDGSYLNPEPIIRIIGSSNLCNRSTQSGGAGSDNTIRNLRYSCLNNGRFVQLRWDPVQSYDLRMDADPDNPADGWNGTCSSPKGDQCAGNILNGFDTGINPNTKYRWWVHSLQADKKTENPAVFGEDFTCTGTVEDLPTNLSATCTNNLATLSWNGNFSKYRLRVDVEPATDGWTGCSSAAGDFCDDNVRGNTYQFGAYKQNYNWWIHGVTPDGKDTTAVKGTINCPVVSNTPQLVTRCAGNGNLELNFQTGGAPYHLRVDVDPQNDPWTGCSSPKGDYCKEDILQRSYNIKVQPNTLYKLWYHGTLNGSQLTPALGNLTVSCPS